MGCALCWNRVINTGLRTQRLEKKRVLRVLGRSNMYSVESSSLPSTVSLNLKYCTSYFWDWNFKYLENKIFLHIKLGKVSFLLFLGGFIFHPNIFTLIDGNKANVTLVSEVFHKCFNVIKKVTCNQRQFKNILVSTSPTHTRGGDVYRVWNLKGCRAYCRIDTVAFLNVQHQ